METDKTLFDYIRQVFVIFGGTIGIMNIFCLLFGEGAKMYSSMFSLGNKGLGITTAAQFFLISIIIAALRYLFFSDKIIRKLSLGIRIVLTYLTVFLAIVVFVILFDWFPIGQWQPWVGFLLCFGTSVAVSTVVAMKREKSENARMERALKRYKEEKNEHE